jgi:hypothetical protein
MTELVVLRRPGRAVAVVWFRRPVEARIIAYARAWAFVMAAVAVALVFVAITACR